MLTLDVADEVGIDGVEEVAARLVEGDVVGTVFWGTAVHCEFV